MILPCAPTCAFLLVFSSPAPPPQPLQAPVKSVKVVLVHDTWNNSGDPTIPAWTPYLNAGKFHVRPETARAWRGKCGRRAKALAHFIFAHETAHATGTLSESNANAYAYRVAPSRLLPPHGTLLSTWRALRPRCLPN